MIDFIITFYISNLLLAGIILILSAVKKLLSHILPARMQYYLWIPLLVLLAAVFLPFPDVQRLLFWTTYKNTTKVTSVDSGLVQSISHTNWMNDFSLSISREAPSYIGLLLWGIWLIGIGTMLFFLFRSQKQLHILEQSALPIRNKKIQNIYQRCLTETGTHHNIPIYRTALLPSPVIVGIWRPRIYLPEHLLAEYDAEDLRYMLLHELLHEKYKDNLINVWINLANVFYWFNPLVWYATKEMRNERELACDASVLLLLSDTEYKLYGHTLLNFSEKIAFLSHPFTTGISSDMKRMKQRIVHIHTYRAPDRRQKQKACFAYFLITLLLLSTAPVLSAHAAAEESYQWDSNAASVSYLDLSDAYAGYQGCFVLYDTQNDSWCIYNKEQALTRVSPNSTYKIYDAILALKSGIITSENTFQIWDGTSYPFETWNQNQTLQSAMASSVNWYFQNMDMQLGSTVIQEFLSEIQYGNETMDGNLTSYWMEGTLKISPVEQVILLDQLYHNDWGFPDETIQTVKDAICLSDSQKGILYGKTGTGRIENEDVNGWFIGYIEQHGNTYIFASNIQAHTRASGSKAAEITLDILTQQNLWKE